MNENTEQLLLKNTSILQQSEPIELYYQIKVDAKIKKQIKTIIYPQTGLIPAKSFTAILGPSGSGKTTLLNFLAGRLMSNNLVIQGQYQLNSHTITSVEPYSNKIGYVMQEDALLGSLTPRQCFQFAADLRLIENKERKKQLIQELIQQLGLKSCADTKVGNNFIKGISGGQRKRTSIGVELITNPSLIFLDEPTTGLDSSTALQVILLLKDLANKGKTIISTIHQPSSELFCQFDRLLMIVDGKCIYNGLSLQAQDHFASMGHKCPQLMNASQFYLDLMSLSVEQSNQQEYETKKKQHDIKMQQFQSNYLKSKYAKIQQDKSLAPVMKGNLETISIFAQFYYILYRSLITQIRNPMDVGFKIIQSIFTSVIVYVVFGRIDNSIAQNIQGITFFIASNNAFGGIQGTLATFTTQRPVFLRQRFSKSYSTIVYFLARTLCNFPFELIYPTIGISIIYWSTGVGNSEFYQFLRLVCMCNSCYFLSASYGLFYAALIPKLQTAMALVPLLIIPFMLLGGFFINLDNVSDIRVIFFPIMYLSPFKYSFQAGLIALEKVGGKAFKPDSFEYNILIMTGLGIILRILSAVAMQIVSNPKRPKIKNNS